MTAADAGTVKLPELLAPCGSREALEAALKAGADAVYFGGTMHNARMHAKNFQREQLPDAIRDCHSAGVRAYITLNTQILDRELKEALEYAAFLYESGADALILADMGLSSLIHARIPELELHASTQMTAHSAEAARLLQKLGFQRMVCGREMREKDIEALVKASPIEIEMFIHGAICVSCSGQCMLSAVMGGRSGNRGACAQPCRLPYSGGYPLSLRDMCLAGHIPALIRSGVASLKIEGRMKSPAYVYGVTRIYRRLLDEQRAASPAELKELEGLFSRGGFTDGYYTGKIGSSMLGIRSETDRDEARGAGSVSASARNVRTLPAITLSGRTPPRLPDRLPFPRKRAALRPISTARFYRAESIPDTNDFTHVYLPPEAFAPGRADGVFLPPVIFDSELDTVRRRLEFAASHGATQLLLSGPGQVRLAEEFGMTPHGDFRLNVFNTFSCRLWCGLTETKPESILVSPELILPQIRDIVPEEGVRKGAVVYGRLPLMFLEKPVGKPELRDRKNARFPVLREGKRDILCNSVPIYMGDQTDRLDAAGIEERHFIFTTEDRNEVLRVAFAYRNGVIPKDSIRRLK